MLTSRLLPALCLSIAGLCISPAFGAEDGATRVVVQGNTLEDFFTAALEYSPELRISRERWNIGTARRRATNGQLLPQINANASLSDNKQLANSVGVTNRYNGERYSVQLSQVLFNWQAFNARSQAYLLEDQAEADYYAQLAFVLTDVADRYFAVLQSEDAVISIHSEFDAVSRQLNQIETLYNLQSAQITDLYNAQARLAAVQAEQLNLESELDIAKEALRAASGVNVGDLFRLDEGATVPNVQGSVESWLEQARSGNFQIRARQFAVEAADKLIAQRQGAYMPRVSLIAQQQRSDIGYDNTQQPYRTDTTFVGVDVSIPLFAGGSNRASVSEARSQRSITENELRQTELEVVQRTRTAYLQVKASELRVNAAQRLADSTELSYTAMQRGFELGTVNSVDVLNALRDRFSAERDLQRARYDLIRYNLLLKRDAGTLSADDLLEIGTWLSTPQN
ncbi:MAG: TolC family protein [Pseudomonadales bacterium]|nr:TolC family protein [Pseudomonadales bacterium]